jgi:hypothetical protein
MAMFLVGRGGLVAQPPLGRVAEAMTATLLPTRLVHEFGLRASALSSAAIRVALATTAPFYRRLPQDAVAIPARSLAARRLVGRPPSRLAAWTERQLFGLSRRVTAT